MTCADCGAVEWKPCPSGFRIHQHCPCCGHCTRTSDGGRRSCGGNMRDVKATRRKHDNVTSMASLLEKFG